jgi:hypothetical protein
LGRDQQQPGRFAQGEQGGLRGQPGRQAAFLGVQAAELTADQKTEHGLTDEEGVLITDVVPNSPAAQAGLRRGDVILRINGKDVTDADELRQLVQQAGAGKQVKLEVIRGKNHRQMTARLEENPEEFGGTEPRPGQQPYYGRFPAGGQGQPLMDQSQELQRLNRRIQQLERRIRDLEQKNQGGTR